MGNPMSIWHRGDALRSVGSRRDSSSLSLQGSVWRCSLHHKHSGNCKRKNVSMRETYALLRRRPKQGKKQGKRQSAAYAASRGMGNGVLLSSLSPAGRRYGVVVSADASPPFLARGTLGVGSGDACACNLSPHPHCRSGRGWAVGAGAVSSAIAITPFAHRCLARAMPVVLWSVDSCSPYQWVPPVAIAHRLPNPPACGGRACDCSPYCGWCVTTHHLL